MLDTGWLMLDKRHISPRSLMFLENTQINEEALLRGSHDGSGDLLSPPRHSGMFLAGIQAVGNCPISRAWIPAEAWPRMPRVLPHRDGAKRLQHGSFEDLFRSILLIDVSKPARILVYLDLLDQRTVFRYNAAFVETIFLSEFAQFEVWIIPVL